MADVVSVTMRASLPTTTGMGLGAPARPMVVPTFAPVAMSMSVTWVVVPAADVVSVTMRASLPTTTGAPMPGAPARPMVVPTFAPVAMSMSSHVVVPVADVVSVTMRASLPTTTGASTGVAGQADGGAYLAPVATSMSFT